MELVMRTLADHLSSYAAYHRDRRNLATHFIGVPMIVVAVAILLSRPQFDLAGIMLSPAWLVVAATLLFYLRLSAAYALAMAVVLGAALWAAHLTAPLSTAIWLACGAGLFVVGWVIQFIGHAFEGRKPAFVDDLVGLLIGPLFLVAETAFALGLSRALRQQVTDRAGPMRSGPVAPAQPARLS
jgi:uncharacterized membrane protein YGL010W